MSYKVKDIPIMERPRERLKNYGANSLTDSEILSILIGSGTRDKSVKDISLDILSRYDLCDLRNVSIPGLVDIDGIGEVKAIEILAAIELGKRIFLRKSEKLHKLSSAKEIWEDSKYLFNGLKQECFYALYFNNKQELLERKLLFMGTINKSIIHPREIFREAYKLSASSIICMHNHPSNDITPSKEDILFTENIVKTGMVQGIPVLDHIIVGDENYYSFYDEGRILNL